MPLIASTHQVLGLRSGAHVRVRQPHFPARPGHVLRVLHSRRGALRRGAHFLPYCGRAPRLEQRRSAVISCVCQQRKAGVRAALYSFVVKGEGRLAHELFVLLGKLWQLD